MSRSHYKIYEPEFPYFLTSSFVEGFPLLADPRVARIVLDGLTFLQKKRAVTVYAWVLMENHLHLIAQGEALSEKIRNFKAYTAKEIVDVLSRSKLRQLTRARLRHKTQSTHQVWQEGFHPKQIIGDAMMVQKIEYIHNNPVKRGYVDQPQYWRYSSARDYAGHTGLIPVTLYSR